LVQLVTHAYLDGNLSGQPRIDFPLLEQFSSDIIALSGDMMGELAQHVVSGKTNDFILPRVAYYQKIF
jgi:DNA polymerase III alpha subunit